MKKRTSFFISLCLFLFLIPVTLHGQTSTGTELKSTQFDTAGFPSWAKDLRRAEIVAFGSFPFTIFFATFAMDTYRYASHSRDRQYAPWPFKPAGAVNMSRDELVLTMSIAAAGSVAISLADFFIVKHKQRKQQRELEKISGESPIILRSRPLSGGGPLNGEGPLSGEGTQDAPGSGEIAPAGAPPETP
jgi:hypothetical protein